MRHDVLTERLEVAWLNLIRVRRLCQLLCGYDPNIEGFDQKPVMARCPGCLSKRMRQPDAGTLDAHDARSLGHVWV